MSAVIANHLRPRREKVFGEGPRIPLDREAKVRIMHLARALKHKTTPGKHYGILTKFVDVLHAMLWLIHDGHSGQCNPSYATIAAKAGCAMSTVCEAVKALELAGILSWVNRIVRVRIRERDLFGQWATTWRVLRTSNAYVFRDPKAVERSKTEIRSEPPDNYKNTSLIPPELDPDKPLHRALLSFGHAAGFLEQPGHREERALVGRFGAPNSVCVALKALEDAGLLTWVHRLTRIRRREQDLFGHWGSVWQVIRTSNGYRLLDPLDREPGRRGWFACKSESPARPQNREKKNTGPRLDGAAVIPEAGSLALPKRAEPPAIAPQQEHGLSSTERAALIARLDSNPTKADWTLYERELDALLIAAAPLRFRAN